MPTMQDIQDQVTDLKKEIEGLRTLISDSGHGAIVNHGKRLEVDVSTRISDLINVKTITQKQITSVSYWDKNVVARTIFPREGESVTIKNIPHETDDFFKYLIASAEGEGGEIRYRTGAELIGDIGYWRRVDGVIFPKALADALLVRATVTIDTIAHETTNVDKILVTNAGLIKYITGDELISYIGLWQKNGIVLSPKTDGDRISIEDNLYSKQSDGNYFGRVHLTENQLSVDNIGDVWKSVASLQYWKGIAISSDGRIQTGVASHISEGYIWTSDDYGLTWTQRATLQYWYSIAMSSDGKLQTAGSAGSIYISDDYGATWTEKATSETWVYIAMSSDGRIQTALTGSSWLWQSFDYGATWTVGGIIVEGIAMSSDGRIQTCITINTENVYVSSDYGATWTYIRGITDSTKVAMSSDGKIQTVVASGGYIWISDDYGATWTQKATLLNWKDIAMSSDGVNQVAVINNSNPWVSTDYGATWTEKANSQSWRNVTMSSDAKVIAAISGANQYIWVSYADSTLHGNIKVTGNATFEDNLLSKQSDGNYLGRTHITENQLSLENIGAVFNVVDHTQDRVLGCATSSDGKYIIISKSQLTDSAISSDYGKTWSSKGVVIDNPSMSSDGKYIIGYNYSSTGPYLIAVSNDYGETFSTVSVLAANYFGGSCMSSDARYMYVSNRTSGFIYRSIDYGVTWSTISDFSAYDVVTSSDGSIVVAVRYDEVRISHDYGITWETVSVTGNWEYGAMSSDAMHITLSVGSESGGGDVKVSHDYGETWATTATASHYVRALCMTSSGKHQLYGEWQDDLYISSDYGETWAAIGEGGSRPWTCAAMSGDGKITIAGVSWIFAQTKTIYISYADSVIHGVFELQQPVFDDLQFPLSGARVPASNAPTWEALTANGNAYSFGIDDYKDTQANEVPHTWKEGTNGRPHLHITTKAANSTGSDRFAKFTVWVSYCDTDETWQETSFTAELTIPDGTPAIQLFYLDMGGDLTLTNYLIEAEMKMRVKRIAATGGTEYSGRIFITQGGIHISHNTMGSRQERTK